MSWPTAAKSSIGHTPLGGFVIQKGAEVVMMWFLALPIICLAVAAFMWRFERHLEELTGPWISD
jgi:hypothetical protein